MNAPVATPIVNLNGSDRATLLAQESAVLTACTALAEALRGAFPHGRDFQLNAPGDYERAREQSMAEIAALQEIVDRHTAIALAVSPLR